MAWVVRAGEASAQSLMQGYAEHNHIPGLYGFSVQYAPGLSLDDLALSGRFPNATVSFEDEAVLQAALTPIGYRIQLRSSPGMGHHHTFCVILDRNGIALTTLPAVVADVLTQTFQRMPNPHRVPKRRRP
jgi:hypothetical protein